MSTPEQFFADISRFTEKAKRNAELVVRKAAQYTFEDMTQRQPSVKETGGSFEVGKVPVDTGFLVNSTELRINGGSVAQGGGGAPADFAAGLAGFNAGDEAEAVFTAPYARRINYGFSGTDSLGRAYNQAGRLFVQTALSHWQQNVDRAAAEVGQ